MTVKLYGRTGSAHAHAIRDFLHRSDVPLEWIEVPSDEAARALGLDGPREPRLPVCEFPDGTRMERPTIRQITEKLGWFRDPSQSEYDVADDIQEKCRRNGLLVSTEGSTVLLLPSLAIDKRTAARGLDILARSI